MSSIENIHSSSIEDIFGLINSSQESVSSEIKNVIKDQFSNTSDRWLIHGLLEYFFSTSSKRLLDIIISAPEPHSKFLLEKISHGIKNCDKDRFRYISLLLYAISRDPPPHWTDKIPCMILKDLLDMLSRTRDCEISALVSGIMVIVLILPLRPLDVNRFIKNIFDCFWKVITWIPYRNEELSLKPYLQVAAYSLFHRLYALYPCGLIRFIRSNTLNLTSSNKSIYIKTLHPMLERVRLHPLLVSETEDTEASKSRWSGLEPNDIIHECAKLCIDPLHEICEDIYVNEIPIQQTSFDIPSDSSNYFVLCSSDNTFWCPGVSESPNMIPSIQHTPICHQQSISQNKKVESPPEAAIEATPETTPFASPLPSSLIKPDFKIAKGSNLTSLLENINEHKTIKRDHNLTKEFQQKKDAFSVLNKSIMDELQHHETHKYNQSQESHFIDSKTKIVHDKKIEKEKSASNQSDNLRIRKMPASQYDQKKVLNFNKQAELFSESESEEFSNQNEHCSQNSENDYDASYEFDENSGEESLGFPSREAMTEIMKNVKTNRLRFLSQCGPPPNLALLDDLSSKSSVQSEDQSASSEWPQDFVVKGKKRQRRKSYPDTRGIACPDFSTKPKHELAPFSLSQIKTPVELSEMATQTEESPVFDPLEHLIEVMSFGFTKTKNVKNPDVLSPYYFLENYSKIKGSVLSSHETSDIAWNLFDKYEDQNVKNHMRCLHCLLMMERYKREAHAIRNRRLLGKIRRNQILQECNSSSNCEKKTLKHEISNLQNSLSKIKDENELLKSKVSEMVDQSIFNELQDKYFKALNMKENLKNISKSQYEKNRAISAELDECRSQISEFQRQLNIHRCHSKENSALKEQVEELNKRIIILGEIQLEMQNQIKDYKEKQKAINHEMLEKEKSIFIQRQLELENNNRADKTSLHASLYRINELENELKSKNADQKVNRTEIDNIVSSWEEKYSALEARNIELSNINISLQNRIMQLVKNGKKENSVHEKRENNSHESFPTSLNTAKSLKMKGQNKSGHLTSLWSNFGEE